MPRFSRSSKVRLQQCDVRLQRVFNKVIETYDCTILCGHRGKDEQDEAWATGRSKVRWPEGEHNGWPSRAVDAAPYPVKWGGKILNEDGTLNRENLDALLRFYHFAGYVLGVAAGMGIRLRWGGDWDGDRDLADQTFNDLVHFELED